METVQAALNFWWVLPIIAAIGGYKLVLKLFGVIIIPDDKIGLVKKKFVLLGANKDLPPGRIIALKGEAGFQADTLSPGLHYGFFPWQYEVIVAPFTVITAGNIGIVEAKDGNALPAGRIIATQVDCDNFQDARAFLEKSGERGPQMAFIRPGTYRINTLIFDVKHAPMTNIEKGKIGIVEARDGKPLSAGRVIGRVVDCNTFQDGKMFIDAGGERGPQMAIIPQGQYAINTWLFDVKPADVVDIPEGKIGIVTAKEGAPLPTGEIAGPEVPGHNSFQDPMAFVASGGNKGLQEQVLMPGRYFINPAFATVEMTDLTEVPIASAGVVVAFVGKKGVDQTGEGFKHGDLVGRGERGVWVDVLDPGKYPINPRTHKVRAVQTANIVLNWATGKSEAHKLDANLSTITVRSSDGYTFNLDVSQIIHISRKDAPRVIARFGTLEAFITQVLEPMIGNYFRNAAQNSDVIEFLAKRTERQAEAREQIEKALREYDVVAVDTLIGDIVPPAELMKTLTDRKLAEQAQITYATQCEAAGERQKLMQAEALADTQGGVVASERKVAIAKFEAAASVESAEGQAKAKTINAKADAEVRTTNASAEAGAIKMLGDAEAGKVLAIGQAEATVAKEKVAAMDADNYASVLIAQAIADAGKAGMKIVPEVMVNGGANGQGGTLVDVLMAGLVRDGVSKAKPADKPTAPAGSKVE